MHLSGKFFLITSGNSGIGLAAAEVLAKAGATVAIFGRDPVTILVAAAQQPDQKMINLSALDKGGRSAHRITGNRIVHLRLSDIASILVECLKTRR